MPNLRTIWHFKPQNALHQRMLNPTIANFFAILLQYNSKARIVLQQYSKKNIYIFYSLFLPKFLSSISLFQFSSLCSFFVSPSAFSSLQTQTPLSSQHQHHTSQWLIFSGGLRFGGFFGFFFFFCDLCLKEDRQCLGRRLVMGLVEISVGHGDQ